VGAFVRMVCYCAQHLTDGRIDRATALSIAGRERVLATLTTVGLLDEIDDDSLEIHGYLERNPSRSSVERERASNRDRQRRFAENSHAKRKAAQAPNAVSNASRNAVTNDAPVPSRPVQEEETPTPLAEPTPALALEEPKTGADAPASASAGGVVVELFKHWQRVHKHPTAKLDAKRRKAIERAVKSHGADVVRAAIDGCAKSAFHQGENDRGQVYVDLTLILRDASKIEGFAALAAPAAQPSKPAPVTQPPLVTATSNVHRFNPFPASAYRKAAGT
jgi:cell wall-associated NlpC family hydrolase